MPFLPLSPDPAARPGRVARSWLLGLLAGLLAVPVLRADRRTLDFNPDWKFLRDDVAGAAAPGFADGAWADVSTPHTFNDVDTFAHWSTPGHRGEQIQWSGRTWYRKHFRLPALAPGARVFIEFEAARQMAEVYCNGTLLGTAQTGFTPFGFDLTPYLERDGDNLLAVMVDNRFMKDPLDDAAPPGGGRPRQSAPNPNLEELSTSVNRGIPEDLAALPADQIPWNNPHWHPAHGGLYRNVRLYITDAVHISLPLYSFLQTAGPYAYATELSAGAARIGVEIPVQNQGPAGAAVTVETEIFSADGRPVFAGHQDLALAAAGSSVAVFSGSIPNPLLWEPADPHVYRVVAVVRAGGTVRDRVEIPLGLRVARWSATAGFFLNGNHLKLHGWGQKPTDEWPGLGAAQPDWLHAYTVRLMHEAGGNFIRWGHAATGPASIAAADRLGLVTLQPGVDGEHDTVGAAWKLRAMAFRDTIIYFRNHPAILIWEGGNQKVSREHARELRGYMDKYDPHGGRAYAHRRADTVTAEFMDIQVGTEGGREIAQLPVVEGEYDREESPRRVWDKESPPNFGYPEAKGMTYDLTSEEFAVNQAAQYVRKLGPDWHSGGANWIFSDSTSGGRVPAEVARAGGEVDGVRLPKAAYGVMQAMFRDDPQVHLLGHWTYPAGTRKTIYVAANLPEVELFLNGKSLGRGEVSEKYLHVFRDVAWEPGELRAVGRGPGGVSVADVLHPAGPAVALRLQVHAGPGGLRADGADVALIDAEAVDARGERCPTLQQRADFTVAGPGVWRGGYNSGKIDSINHPFLDLECGINRVAVRSTRTAGRISLTVTSAGLQPATVTFESRAVAVEHGLAPWVPEDFGPASAGPSPSHPNLTSPLAVALPRAAGAGPAGAGHSRARIARFNYSGPAGAAVMLQRPVQAGEKIYCDRDYVFGEVPSRLRGADWIRTAEADAAYSAVDLYEIAVPAGTVLYIAHDRRAAVPSWLAQQFAATGSALTVDGQPLELYQRAFATDGSVTLGSNTDEAHPPPAHQYVVFGAAASPDR